MSRIPEIRVFSPVKKGKEKENTSVFNWHTTKSGTTAKVDSKPQRFFGSNSFGLSALSKAGKNSSNIMKTKWGNTFNMRAFNLNNFPTSTTSYRTTYRSHAVAMQRARLGFVTGTANSLDLLRQNLQKSINKEIDEIIQKYLEKFFKLAVENIKLNNGENSVTEQHILAVCRQILEEAKKMYIGNSFACGTFRSAETIEVEHNASESKIIKPAQKSLVKKLKESDTDSEASASTSKPKKRKKGRPPKSQQGSSSGRSTPLKVKLEEIKREGPKWDPARITSDSEFIMGAKANKALGLGATRGRLYTKHPEVFKYFGDQEDKQWLHDHHLMAATGGKAYLLLVEDIRELAQSEEYRNTSALKPEEILGFTLPETILQKVRDAMYQMRTDVHIPKRGRHKLAVINMESSEPNIKDNASDGKHYDSGTVSPTDDLDLLSTEVPYAGPSPFGLGAGFEDISPAQTEISPVPSDISGTLEPPLTAPFEITSTP